MFFFLNDCLMGIRLEAQMGKTIAFYNNLLENKQHLMYQNSVFVYLFVCFSNILSEGPTSSTSPTDALTPQGKPLVFSKALTQLES